ncbi:MAG: hypothetical protein GWP15_04220, partial [Nitrospirae bacterium]|nr:hypothetical protein [Nitrospirota bacterium]
MEDKKGSSDAIVKKLFEGASQIGEIEETPTIETEVEVSPIGVIQKYVEDREKLVMFGEVFLKFLDVDHNFRLYLAKRDDTPSFILGTLLNYDSSYDDQLTRDEIFENPNTPQEVLEYYVEKGKCEDRRHIAANPSISLQLMKKLSEDSDPSVRCAVAQSRNTQMDILTVLAGDEDEYVRMRVVGNSNTTEIVLLRLASDV